MSSISNINYFLFEKRAWGELNESFANDRRSLPSGTHGGDRDRDWNHHHLHCSSVHLGVSAMKMKKMSNKSRKKVREPRFSFKTLSDVDVLDDGYKWRKYGQKVVKNTQHPRLLIVFFFSFS